MNIPEQVLFIIEQLETHGYEAYAVGGCVRDMLLDRTPEDWDITTSARPEEVKSLFRRTINTGIQHGTVTIMIGQTGYEVTTYRMDGAYEDHRHPKEILYTPSLIEDLKRRDFTINAMAYHPKEGIIDHFGGMEDIRRKQIRCVGEPLQRFDEDALRMLRGIRFAGQLDFTIDPDTLSAMQEKSPTLVNVSAERIRTELTKLLLSDGADRLLLASETRLSQYFLPELDSMLHTAQNNPHHRFDVGHHSLEAVTQINRLCKERGISEKKTRIVLAYAALLHDVAKPDCRTTDGEGVDHFYRHNEVGAEKARKILRRFKFDNDSIRQIVTIIQYHDTRHENCLVDGVYSPRGKKAMRRLIHRVGKDTIPLLFLLQRADLLAQSDYKKAQKLSMLDAGERCCREIIADHDAIAIKDLAIDGHAVIRLGAEPGPQVGEILQVLLQEVMDDPKKNEPDALAKLVKMILGGKDLHA